MIYLEINEISSKTTANCNSGVFSVWISEAIRFFVGVVRFLRSTAKSNSFENLRSAQEMSTISAATVNNHDVCQRAISIYRFSWQIAALLKQNHKKCMQGKFSARKRNKTQESDEETRDFAVNSEISNDMQERAVRSPFQPGTNAF